jgi:ubiquinone/menaquinone biosynthesis C-methylase UbiE
MCSHTPRRQVIDFIGGIDPSPFFLSKARELGEGLTNVSFDVADGRSLPFKDKTFDVVVYHTTTSASLESGPLRG